MSVCGCVPTLHTRVMVGGLAIRAKLNKYFIYDVLAALLIKHKKCRTSSSYYSYTIYSYLYHTYIRYGGIESRRERKGERLSIMIILFLHTFRTLLLLHRRISPSPRAFGSITGRHYHYRLPPSHRQLGFYQCTH